MSNLELFLIALGLSMDCLAIAICFGATKRFLWKDILLMAFFFGLFQGIMPVIGWLVGDLVQAYIEKIDHWLAFGILAFIGIRMILESSEVEKKQSGLEIRSWKVLLSLSFATSIDALFTGVSFGFIDVDIIRAVVIISLVTYIMTIAGSKLGEKTTIIPARYAEIVGGIVLIAIGVKIVLEHLHFI
jgi:putative Mn2+ efflux pump MntP